MKQLVMRYAGGGIVRHLGLQNYKGPVSALAELIANTWDADATEVRISLPLGRAISSENIISVKDNGSGMSYEDCDNKYLVIGRNRRLAESTDRTPGGRLLMAHKGLGKLAGFGIARTLEVKTITENILTHFVMSFDQLDKLQHGESYEPTMITDGEETEESSGTEILLRDLTLSRAINEEQFRLSMSKRFSIFSDTFRVYLNDIPLEKREIELDFRFPEEIAGDVTDIQDGYGITILPNGFEIKWWMGFTEDTIKEKEVHGVSVISRGRSAQDPWDFDLAGGTWGQHGLRYLTGEIIADFVDEGLDYESDTILTNRSSLSWEHPDNSPLYTWAKATISSLLRIWAERRGERTFRRVEDQYPEITRKIDRFQPREQRDLRLAMRSLSEIPTMQPERLVSIFDYVIDGYQDKAFTEIIEEIRALPPEERVKTIEILREFDVAEAIRVHKIVRSHVDVITRFEEMIEAGVRERPEMHEHIIKYPWLLGIKYQPMDSERTLKRILEDRFGIAVEGDEHGRKRLDILVIRGGKDVVVIELKRPTITIGLEELTQIRLYVDYLRVWLDDTNTDGMIGRNITGNDVEGYLIGYELDGDRLVGREKERLEESKIFVCAWRDILMKTKDDHREFLNIVKSRAPEDDPRIIELEESE